MSSSSVLLEQSIEHFMSYHDLYNIESGGQFRIVGAIASAG